MELIPQSGLIGLADPDRAPYKHFVASVRTTDPAQTVRVYADDVREAVVTLRRLFRVA